MAIKPSVLGHNGGRVMKIFVLDDDHWRIGWFLNTFGARNVDYAHGPIRAIAKLCLNKYDKIFLDHDLGGAYTRGPNGDGIDVVKVMHEEKLHIDTPIVIHTMNEEAGKKMEKVLSYEHKNVEVIPFWILSKNYESEKDSE
jgi:hypothetical protein